jgi:hypothetical protein
MIVRGHLRVSSVQSLTARGLLEKAQSLVKGWMGEVAWTLLIDLDVDTLSVGGHGAGRV